MDKRTLFSALALLTFVGSGIASGVSAQTVGIGATKRGYTSQASAAISKVISQNAGFQMRVQPFGGSGAYVPQINSGALEFGLANELESYYAGSGTAIYKGRKQSNLRMVARLQPFRVAIYVPQDSPIKTIADLRGKRVSSGWTSQKIIGVLMNGQLANGGISYADVKKVPVANVVASANDMASGKADMFFFAFGAGKVKETNARVGGIRALGIDTSPAAIARMKKHVPPAYALAVKPSKRNVGVMSPIHVMAYDYMMLSSTKVSADMVYKVVKTLHANKKALVAAFGAMRAFNTEKMVKAIPGVPYHPGAVKFYKEVGQWPAK